MSEKVTLVVLKRTRQVMAVATRQAVPATALAVGKEDNQLAENAAEELKVLVGTQLVVRDLVGPVSGSPAAVPDVITSGITFSTSDLDVITVDLNPNVFKLKDARDFVVDADKKLAPGLDPTANATEITLHATLRRITLTLSAIPAKDTPVTVWIYRDDRSRDPEPREGVIKQLDPVLTSPPSGVSIDLDGNLSKGDYHFLALVQGYKPAVFEQQVV